MGQHCENCSGYCLSRCDGTAGISHSLRESDAAGSCCADTTGILKFQDLGKKNREEARRMEEQERQRKEAREAESQRKKGLMRPRQQKKLAMEKENIHTGLSRFLW